MKLHRFLFLGLIFYFIVCSLAHAVDWMPDAHLEEAVREKLEIPDEISMLPADMTGLYDLVIEHDVESLRGLEHAINLEFLHIGRTEVSDLTPLAGLENLRVLKLFANRITDITPLAGLINLEVLELQDNQIVDISPLKGLVNLKELNLGENPILDFTPIYGLVGIETLRLGDIPIDPEALQILNPVDGVVCDVAGEPILPRIENREYPSFFGAWHNIINLPTLSAEERLAFHDLYFCCPMFGLSWVSTPDGLKIRGHIEGAKIERDAIRAWNPNILFLVGITHYTAASGEYPDDSPYWLRDEEGNRVEHVGWSGFWLDYTHSDIIDITVQRALAVAKCGLYDGVFFDHWSDGPRLAPYRTLEEERVAKDTILKRIRAEVGDDFLIMVNTNRDKIPRWAEHVNGTFMETNQDNDGGYAYKSLFDIESTLLWSEENLREPQINGLEGWGIESEPLDSPRNKKWMRLFTTMSLTHSDGYVQFVTGIGNAFHTHQYEIWEGHSDEHARGQDGHDHQHQHYWYDFWDAPLGQPVSGDETKAQLYEDREGLFIREFTNGWAVYNRSGKEQEIELPEEVSGWDSGVEHQRSHVLPDLDGEIYLKTVVQVAPGEYPPLYWINPKTDTLQRLVGTEVKNLVSEAQNATSLTVDTATETLYWTEKTSQRTGKIQSAPLDGTNVELVKDLTSAPLDIALDTVGEKLYLSNAWGKIQRMNLDGSNFESNLITGLKAPQNLVLDTTSGQLYWTEQTGKTTGKIQRANFDGSNVQLVKALTSAPRGMALDAVNRKLYLTNTWGKLQHMNLDGSNFQPDFITGLEDPGQVVVDVIDGKLYWTEQGKLRRADLNGENIQDVVTGLGQLTDIGLGIDSRGEMGVAAAPMITQVVEQTQLLANYPNPFNPETWIPYQLSEPAEVTLRIYAVNGILVRTLALGQTPAGIYQNRSRAAYWNGRNDVGEPVASGIYFYTLTAGDFTATRKLLIRK